MVIKINDPAREPSGSRDVGLGSNSDLAGVTAGTRHDQYDGIDWSGAAPGWASMLTGLVLPLVGFAVLTAGIDLGLIWLAGRWAGAANASPLLLAAIMLPVALILAFGGCKLLLHFKDAKTAAQSAGRKGAV